MLAGGSPPLEYQWFFNETNLVANATNADLVLSNVTAAAAGTYTVSVSNLLGGLISQPATLTVLLPPSIASEPSDFVATNGASASFTVAATGTEPLTYQWFFNQTNELAGATGTNLDLTALTPAQAGHYSVVVSNQVGTLRSREALLTILTAPIIVQDPLDQVATNGDTVTFTVLAGGSAPLEYQWYLQRNQPAGKRHQR